jgi:hypothetical protein
MALMAISLDNLTNKQLQNLIENHQRKSATDAPIYTAALQELERRTGKGLDFDKSFSIIVRAAKRKEFLTYKELPDRDFRPLAAPPKRNHVRGADHDCSIAGRGW